MRRFFLDAKAKTDQWLYPPSGTHINALALKESVASAHAAQTKEGR